MTGKHYQWHKRWAVDLAARFATHDSGMVVDFSCVGKARTQAELDALDFERPDFGCLALPKDGSVWVGRFRGGKDAVDAWLTLQGFDFATRQRADNALRRVARIMREAGDAWAWQKNKKAYDEKRNANT
jgi:hypothetical protein